MFKQRDIYMIYFGPGKGHEYRDVRPAVVLMADDCLRNANVISCVPLTSNLRNVVPDDVFLHKDNSNSLFHDSVAKMHHVTGCDKSRIIRYVGRVADEDWNVLCSRLKRVFGI